MQLFLFLFPLQLMKRPALQNKQVGVLRMAFRARKVFGTFEKRAPEVRTVRPNVLTTGPGLLLLSSHTAGGYLRLFCEVFGVYF